MKSTVKTVKVIGRPKASLAYDFEKLKFFGGIL
jgi:hypothetical protein